LLQKIDFRKPVWGQKAQWYLALASLKAGRVSEAAIHFKDIASQDGHRYHSEAEKVLERLAE